MNCIALAKAASLGESRTGVQKRARVRSFDLGVAALAATLIPVSLIWDFSWESTIGVDRFWSPPHLATHIGVWLCGLLGARLVFVFTLARHHSEPAAGVNVGKLCGPSGAWILLWGAATVQAALLLDNWWQQAYGLGAGLWHPPQILKATGFFTLLFGGIVLCAGARANGTASLRTARTLLVWHGGLLLMMCALVLTLKNYPNWQRTAGFYKVSCAIYPAVLLAMGQGSPGRWRATRTALVYMAIVCAMVWLLPLFPARPLTAPIHNPTDHLMPPAFPLLLVVPAVVMDWLRMRFPLPTTKEWGEGQGEGSPVKCLSPENAPLTPALSPPDGERESDFSATTLMTRYAQRRALGDLCTAISSGIVFFAVFLPVQWFFSKFLLSSSADNWFFAGGGRHWPFFLKIDEARVMFWGVKQDPLTWRAALMAMVFAMVSAWIGLRVGGWLNKLRR